MSQENADRARWFGEEVQPHESSLRAYLRNSFPSAHDVDDIVQESFLRVWRAKADHPIQSTKAFLFQVARHLAVDQLRRDKTSPIISVKDFHELAVMEDGANAAEVACTNHEISLLAEAIASLPERCREIVILRKLKGITQKEIALRLGISEQTVQVQAARGLKRCDKFLRRRGIRGTKA